MGAGVGTNFIKLQPFTISRTPFPFRFVRKTTKTGPIRRSHAKSKYYEETNSGFPTSCLRGLRRTRAANHRYRTGRPRPRMV